MRTLLFLFLIGILSFQAPQSAHACSCAMESRQESIDTSEVIFSGAVEDVRADGEWQFGVSMTVDRDWKGLRASESGELTVYTATDSAACGYGFEEGEEYLVYGYRNDESGDVYVSLCSATKLLEDADEDLALLSEGEGWACTMDAKLCPDGETYVGREGPNCEFAACPDEEEPNCAPYVCANGTTHPRCTDDGHVINYFAEPCHMDGGEEGAPFEDVDSTHPNADAIFYVKAQGIVEGYADGTFKPDATINRAEFVKILMGLLEDDDRTCKIAAFADVDQSAWYATFAHRAHCSGLVAGYPDGTFRPATPINFAEAAKILYRAWYIDEHGSWPSIEPTSDPWFRYYVEGLEFLHAIPMTIDAFDDNITRGEMAEMIYRLRTGNVDEPTKTYNRLALSGMVYRNDVFDYEVSLPVDWVKVAHTADDRHISFGEKKFLGAHGYDGQWLVTVRDAGEVGVEELVQGMGNQFADRKVTREEVAVDGRTALKVTVTTGKYVDWIYVAVIVESDDKVFVISNGAVHHDLFDEFYESFRLL